MKVFTLYHAGTVFNIIYNNSTYPWTLLSTDVSLTWAKNQNKEIPDLFINGEGGDIIRLKDYEIIFDGPNGYKAKMGKI